MGEKQRKGKDRSSFAAACNLLSQYLKERSSGDQLGAGMEKAMFRPPTTMDLFPGSNISAGDLSGQTVPIPVDRFTQHKDTNSILKSVKTGNPKESEVNAQLTILYDGKVMVFDNFPARKARDLLVLAGKANSLTETTPTFANPSASDLVPIARKASLHRFLEKRKDRIKSNAPYLAHGLRGLGAAASSEPEKRQAWLELGRRTSFSFDSEI